MVWLSILVAAAPILVCYAARWWLGREGLQPLWIFPSLVGAGGLGGFLFGAVLSPHLEPWFFSLEVDLRTLVNALVVPVAEEIGKGLVLLVFLATRWYRSAVDGLLYGFAAGSGYAMVENLVHFLAALSVEGERAWLSSVAVRLPSALIVHGGSTAIVGAYLGAARWERRALVVFAALPAALFVATGIHGGWNALIEVARQEGSLAHGIAALMLLPVSAGGLWVLLWKSLRDEEADLRAELGAEMRAGLLSESEIQAIVSHRARRRRPFSTRSPDRALSSAAVALAFALRRLRLEGRGKDDVERCREEIRRARRARATESRGGS
jgi:RsiW-degrading membrane proteinase PrsW (M82 family)